MKKPSFLALVLPCLLLSSACTPFKILFNSGFEKPEVRVRDIKHVKTRGLEADIEITLAVQNNNPYALEIASLNYQAEVGDKKMASGTWEKGAVLEAKSQTIVALPLTLQLLDAGSLLASLLSGSKNSLEIRCHGKVVIVTGLFMNLDFPYDEKQSISF